MTIVVTGSRNWTDRRAILKRLMKLADDTLIIEGGALGADRICRLAAQALGFRVVTVRAEWYTHGKWAGPIRNGVMLQMKPDLVLAFRKDMSRGTSDCINQATEARIPVEIMDVP